MSVRWGKQLIAAAGLVVAALLSGCGPAEGLASVVGRVTLDGEPLPNAYVQFICSGENAGTSSGRTDSSGDYYLMFSRSKKGARIGPSKVVITTFDLDGTQGGVKRIPEKVPAKYNVKTELTAEVKPGDNTFDFELKSDVGPLPKARPQREDL
ncbi:hypothetical protein Pan44_00100 [Caulifigura coniformis]|uniref:Carboxypeptidase regulatory-like domain-containing protein n=1 Tax=Caulifigura coniformis TaxID=2527983 RepID=A0A517S799_9PLAN|nr:carboxypeptidase regulatory-like domain-containing protein [Caulifigura coniformis]QDT52004.1 hypothetical protein Pan44_00100 [Caulifigura coniformis]